MKIFAILLLAIFITASPYAQTPVYFPIDSSFSAEIVVPSRYVQYQAGNVSITDEEIKNGTASGLWKIMPEKLMTDFRLHDYWFRYFLKNISGVDQKISFINSNGADRSTYDIFKDGNLASTYKTGYLVPWKEKDGLKEENAVLFTLRAGDSVEVRNHIVNHYFLTKPSKLVVTLATASETIANSYIGHQRAFSENDFEYVFVGLLLFACLFSFFIYFIVRDRVYLFYGFFLFYFLFRPEPLTTILFPQHPIILYLFFYTVKQFGVFLFIHFSRYFLKTFKEFPRWDRLLKQMAVIDLLCQFGNTYLEPFTWGSLNDVFHELSDLSFCAGLLTILITFLKYLRYRDRFIRVIEIAAIPSSVIWFFGFTLLKLYEFLGTRFGIATPDFVNNFATWFDLLNRLSVIWMAIAFSWALLIQYLDLRKQKAELLLDAERLTREKEQERTQLIEKQKVELEITVQERTRELKQTIEHLKETQSQLIQSEKMASLGVLTAGIAHEIQNPLNFVNNFSDLNTELIDEAGQEINQGNIDSAASILRDIRENEQKINHHGKRADSIVKGMLLHSRSTTGHREPADINLLADEYLRLAYHGVRAKEKDFNVTIKTDFDETIPKINIVSQDIGRVLLNVYNNAFYAVHEKKQSKSGEYIPVVWISTKRVADKVLIAIKDNGNGISQNIVDKIFQPFFTTKPTGQGVGLGLSFAYDIIKAHGGEIKVETVLQEGSEFKIQLLVKTEPTD